MRAAAALTPARVSRILGWQVAAPLIGSRPTSFPFISGDTFRALAGLIVETHPNPVAAPRTVNRIRLGGHPAGRQVLFASASVFEPEIAAQVPGAPAVAEIAAYLRFIARLPTLAGWRIIVHNGDRIPDDEALCALAAASDGVLCVNAPDGLPGVVPIPIGLENLWWRGNGLLGDFTGPGGLAAEDPLPPAERDVEVVASFRVGTNPAVRTPLAALVARSRHRPLTFARGPAEFHRLLRRALFVLSPRGNGPDCHRTWEAVYLGAVPVVEPGTLPLSLTRELPILVSGWAEFLDHDERTLRATYAEITTRSAAGAYAPYWIELVGRRSLREAGR